MQLRRIRVDLAGIDVELDDQVVLDLERCEVLVAHPVVQREVRTGVPLILPEGHVVLLPRVPRTGRTVVEDARSADVAGILNAGRLIGQERRDVRIGVGRATELVGRHPDDSHLTPDLGEVIAAH